MKNYLCKSILIGHTDTDYLQKLTHNLNLSNDIAYAVNGLQALDYILNTLPDLIITERGLPLLNGKDLIKIVRKKRILTKFIFVYDSQEEARLFHRDKEIVQGSFLKYDPFEPSLKCIKSVLSGIADHVEISEKHTKKLISTD